MSKKQLVFDEQVNFEKGLTESIDELWDLYGCIEEVENAFDIEFSCGDGKFISDLEDFTEEMDKYDGLVCLKSLPRLRKNKNLMKGTWRFKVWMPEDGWSSRHLTGKLIKSR